MTSNFGDFSGHSERTAISRFVKINNVFNGVFKTIKLDDQVYRLPYAIWPPLGHSVSSVGKDPETTAKRSNLACCANYERSSSGDQRLSQEASLL